MVDELGEFVDLHDFATAWDGRIASGVYTKMVRDDPCSYCGGPGGTIDHIVPLKPSARKTGRHVASAATSINGTGACFGCNNRKDSMSMLKFLLRLSWERENRESARRRGISTFFSPQQLEQMRQMT